MDRKYQDLTMLSVLNCIVDLARNSKLSDEFLEAADRFVCYVSERQQISKMQAVMLALMVENSVSFEKVELSEVAETLNCSTVQILQYKLDIDKLVGRGLLYCTHSKCVGTLYKVPQSVLDKYAMNEAYSQPSYKGCSDMELFQRFYDITHHRFKEEISTELMLSEILRLFAENESLSYVKALRSLRLDPMDEVLVTQFCRHLLLNGCDGIRMDNILFLCDNAHERFNLENSLQNSTHKIMKKKLVERVMTGGLLSMEEYRLTDKTRKRLLKGYRVKSLENIDCNLMQSAEIVPKELFFDTKVQRQLKDLGQLISEEHYHSICARLKEKGLRQGFACLFYGAPGTGKTESVLQLARQSGRAIMQVNISDIKDKYVGESEKNIKEVFEHYKTVTKHSRQVPILLFNEADAIISTRLEDVRRSVDKMENSIQNIILQEMERLDGIMIATTNLVQNLDKAFERRFLYKVRFEKPTAEQRQAIWHSMLPFLSMETVRHLASCYDFSGGQIENITRKCDVEGVLYGEEAVTDERIEQYCKEESIVSGRGARIGFL